MTSKKIRFVTDSTSDIPRDLVEKYGIGVVPCYVNYNGQSFADDGVELIREKYYEEMPNIDPPATTAAPSPGVAQEIIQRTFEGADHLFIVTAPESLSSINNSMRLGSAELPQDRITILDSGTTAMALGWQVLIAADIANETGDVEAVANALAKLKQHSRLYAALATLEYLQKSGRVGWAAASVARILNIKPMVEVESGSVSNIGKARTFKRAVAELIRLTHEKAPLEKLAVMHTNNLEGAQELKEQLADVAPPDTIITNLNPSVGTHAGPGALGISLVSQAWRT